MPTTGTISAKHAYAEPGTYTVTLRLWDDDMAGPDVAGATAGVDYTEETFTVTGRERSPPRSTRGPDQVTAKGHPITLDSLTFTDPRFDASLAWLEQFGTEGHEKAYGVVTDAGAVYVTGLTGGTLPGETTLGGTDAFVAKFDTAGSLLWMKGFGSSETGLCHRHCSRR